MYVLFFFASAAHSSLWEPLLRCRSRLPPAAPPPAVVLRGEATAAAAAAAARVEDGAKGAAALAGRIPSLGFERPPLIGPPLPPSHSRAAQQAAGAGAQAGAGAKPKRGAGGFFPASKPMHRSAQPSFLSAEESPKQNYRGLFNLAFLILVVRHAAGGRAGGRARAGAGGGG